MKWEKWDQMDYTRRNLVGPSPLHEQHLQEVGIPLRFAPEAPKLKKTWVKKEGPMGDFFKDFVSQLAQQFIHTQLDKLTNDVHTIRRVVTGVDADSKRVVVQMPFDLIAYMNLCQKFAQIWQGFKFQFDRDHSKKMKQIVFGFIGMHQYQNVITNMTYLIIKNEHHFRKFDRFRSQKTIKNTNIKIGRYRSCKICPISVKMLS